MTDKQHILALEILYLCLLLFLIYEFRIVWKYRYDDYIYSLFNSILHLSSRFQDLKAQNSSTRSKSTLIHPKNSLKRFDFIYVDIQSTK